MRAKKCHVADESNAVYAKRGRDGHHTFPTPGGKRAGKPEWRRSGAKRRDAADPACRRMLNWAAGRSGTHISKSRTSYMSGLRSTWLAPMSVSLWTKIDTVR